MFIWQTQNWKNLLLISHQASNVFEVGRVFVEKRSLGGGQFGLFVLGVSPKETLNFVALQELCQKEKCLFIQIETFDIPEENEAWFWKLPPGFERGYYKKFITPYTALIDLSKSTQEILSEMKPKGRYNINLAAKKGVEVFKGEKNPANIQIFYDLMQETTSRDGFYGNTKEYYTAFLETIAGAELIFTRLGEQILSAGIFVFQKDVSIYYYGASTSNKEFRNLMAPYLMQWFAIEYAKELGSQYYDFLGIASPGDEHSSLAGVTDFKMKFTPYAVPVSESIIWIPHKFKYRLFMAIKKIKSFL